jgi:hypothetical protein
VSLPPHPSLSEPPSDEKISDDDFSIQVRSTARVRRWSLSFFSLESSGESLDIFDALGVKGVYAQERKQSESAF